MQINKIDGVNFNGVTVVKSKEARLINLLNDVDYYFLRKSKNPKVRFDAAATSTKSNGYWTGILADGKDAKYVSAVSTKNAEEKIVSSVDDILSFPQFKKIKKDISNLYNKMIGKTK